MEELSTCNNSRILLALVLSLFFALSNSTISPEANSLSFTVMPASVPACLTASIISSSFIICLNAKELQSVMPSATSLATCHLNPCCQQNIDLLLNHCFANVLQQKPTVSRKHSFKPVYTQAKQIKEFKYVLVTCCIHPQLILPPALKRHPVLISSFTIKTVL